MPGVAAQIVANAAWAAAEIAEVEERIAQRVQALIGANRIKPHLRDSGLTVRNGRFCLPVKAEHRGRIRGIVNHLEAGRGRRAAHNP